MTLIDLQARQQALDCDHSYIVQAPAGSGKTGVLTQRILCLLSRVKQPEEVLAITFTKKAAAEMRGRVMAALSLGQNTEEPSDDFEKTFYQLARTVNQRDQALGWELSQNPTRLRIMTIDSLGSKIIANQPLSSGLGVSYQVVENSDELYIQASRALLQALDGDSEPAAELERVLDLLDNNYSRLESLITNMLAKRDHWLRDLLAVHHNFADFQQLLESSLLKLTQDALAEVLEVYPQPVLSEFKRLAQYANESIDLFADTDTDIDTWLKTFRPFFTKTNELRRKLDKNCGFPAPGKGDGKERRQEFKQQGAELLDTLSQLGTDKITALLALPSTAVEPAQWQLLSDLITLARYAAAHLRLVCQSKNQYDFTEISLAALTALGSEDAPGQASLVLDEAISHILVDEFQDTSIVQVELLERLTAGWQQDDGRTLFLVGDPMQSIYGFRQADVGLFLRLWQQQRLGEISIRPLSLATNFRSVPGVVDWINQHFSGCFPPAADVRQGAVPYAESTAAKSSTGNDGVQVQLFSEAEGRDAAKEEADFIVTEIQRLDPGQSVAILVKGKNHVLTIVDSLRAAQIPFRAVDMEPLTSSQVVIDLLTLIRVYQSPNDRIAWFSLLRAPWCGLSLQELGTLGTLDPDLKTAVELLENAQQSIFSAFSSRKLKFVFETVNEAYQQRGRNSWTQSLYDLALALGIPATLGSEQEVAAFSLFFELLESMELESDRPNLDLFERRLEQLFVPPQELDPQATPIEIMTMHKSKGLEFDTVFLPQLQRMPRRDDKPMIVLDKQTSGLAQQQELFLAPLPVSHGAAGSSNRSENTVYDYLWNLIRQRNHNETCRLLYVACTRAKRRLYLTGSVAVDNEGVVKAPTSSSLLYQLWPVLAEAEKQPVESASEDQAEAQNRPQGCVNILGFKQPTPEFFHALSTARVREEGEELEDASGINPNSEVATADSDQAPASWQQQAGILFHQLLEVLHHQPNHLQQLDLTQQQLFWRYQLASLAPDAQQLALDLLTEAVAAMIKSSHSQWLFSSSHSQRFSELSVSDQAQEEVKHWIIDRTFVAGETRQIVDFKLAQPASGQSEIAFLAQESAKYQPQLQTYARVMNGIKAMPTKTYLYFPLLDVLHEVAI